MFFVGKRVEEAVSGSQLHPVFVSSARDERVWQYHKKHLEYTDFCLDIIEHFRTRVIHHHSNAPLYFLHVNVNVLFYQYPILDGGDSQYYCCMVLATSLSTEISSRRRNAVARWIHMATYVTTLPFTSWFGKVSYSSAKASHSVASISFLTATLTQLWQCVIPIPEQHEKLIHHTLEMFPSHP